MGRSFAVSGFGKGSGAVAADTRARIETLEAARELELRALLESDILIPGAGGETYRQRAERLGLDRMSLENVARLLRDRPSARTPATERHGAAADMMIGGERHRGHDSWVDGHGDTHIEAYRQNGPHVQRVEVVETRVNAQTRVVTRMRGGR